MLCSNRTQNVPVQHSYLVSFGMSPRHTYYRYWAKSPEGDRPAHLVPYHNLDVAACGRSLLRQNPALAQRVAMALRLDVEPAIRLVTFLLSLHDLGKFSDSFQALQPGLVRELDGPANLAQAPQYGPVYHGALGTLAWASSIQTAWLGTGGRSLGESAPSRLAASSALRPLVDAIMGHHGRPVPLPPERDGNSVPFYSAAALDDACRYTLDAADLLLPAGASLTWTSDFAARATRISWTVAGLAVLADWIGSDGVSFPRTDQPLDLEVYWERATAQAEAAVRRAGVIPAAPAGGGGIQDLFGFDGPTPLQRYAETFQLVAGPQLFVLEDLTGAGKTEAAVVLAHRLMQVGLACGLYVGLPTMATANQMFERLERAVDRLFADPAAASVVLAHSARDLSERFREIALPADPDADRAEGPDQDAPAGVQCAEWIASSRKKALLAALGVGTIDQALLCVLPAAHQSLRLLGLGQHVLVLDEVHAYDEYMLALIERLLTFHAAHDGSAVVLSATLPHDRRQRLADAFRRGLEVKPMSLQCTDDDDYPLATHVHADGVRETPVERSLEARRSLRVRRFRTETEIVRALVDAAASGCCAVWVRNTVGDAVRGLGLVREAAAGEGGICVDLLHARFALGHRLAKEEGLLAALGPKGGHEQRRGRIVVATQVVEQSLDLDADLLVSDLAPIDLLLQRAGRLRRHVRDSHGNRLQGPDGRDLRKDGRGDAIFGVYAPPDVEAPDADWFDRFLRNAGFVYPDHGRLWLSAREVLEGRCLSLPDDARALIRAVYGPGALDAIPEALRPRTHKAMSAAKVDGAQGNARALCIEDGYGCDDTAWTQDDAQRTRIGERSVTVRLIQIDADGAPGPLVPHPRDAWAMSDVSVRESQLAGAIPEGDALALQQATAMMPDRGRHVLLLPLRRQNSGWVGRAVDKRGRMLRVSYTEDKGLELDPV